jgi:Mrp family chromosome partitioning ATPase/capsular polysaccharide biosynthesis protein
MNETTTDAASIFAAIWKRKWLILAVAILVAAGTYEYYKGKARSYSATTQLFLGGSSEPAVGSGAGKPSLSVRGLADQVGLINSTLIGKPVREQLRAEHDLAAVRGKAAAKASGTSDFITITTEARTPKAADDLANAYAQGYIRRQRTEYRKGIQAQLATARGQLRRIETPSPVAKGNGKAAPSNTATLQAASLASKISQLETQLSTFTGVQQVGPARAQPLSNSTSPRQNAIFGFVIGLLLASVAAYLLTRFDRRIRRLADVESILHTQILAALPAVKSPAVRPDGRRVPAKPLLEPLRRLYTTLQLGNPLDPGGRERAPRVILFISPDAGDGRSTLIANLARVQSEAGERVAVVEADFRRPTQARLLDVHGQYGLADVLSGKIGLGEAMQSARSSLDPSPGDGGSAPAPGSVSTVVESRSVGSLSVLVGGGAVANPPALLAGDAMSDLLRSVAGEFDYVLVDVPPPPEVSDAMPLLQLVDGIVLVARIGHTREVSAQRLAQLLGRTASAPVLGAVVNCVPRKDIESYGFSFAPVAQGRRRIIGR